MILPPTLTYVLVVDVEAHRLSQFQAFDHEWMSASEMVHAILQGPSSFIDILGNIGDRIRPRALGMSRYRILLLHPEQLQKSPVVPLMILVTAPGADQAGRDYCVVNAAAEPILHLPSVPHPGETGLFSASMGTFRQWLDRVLVHLERVEPATAEIITSFNRHSLPPPAAPHPFVWADSLTLPNDLALLSVQYPAVRANHRPLHPSHDDTAAIIERSYRQVKNIRSAYFNSAEYPPGSTEMILTRPGIIRSLPAVLPRALRQQYGDDVANSYRSILKDPGFRLVQPESSENRQDGARLERERLAEIDAQVAAVSVEACNHFAPVVSLTKSLASAQSALSQLNDVLRTRPQNWRRRSSNLALTAGQKMSAALPAFLQTELGNFKGTLKAFIDHPIELTAVGDHPLCVHAPTIRIPVTPGSLLSSQVHTLQRVLQPSDFSHVLILRGMLPNDPAFPLIEEFSRQLVASASGVSVTVRDVRNMDDLEQALNEFDGVFAIVDAHGSHGVRQTGMLSLGNTLVSLLPAPSRRLRVPPLIFLAACDTHPVDRPQDTVAASLLFAGASAVVGTLGPVGIVESALLCGNLLSKILDDVPRCPGPIRFSELFASSLRNLHVFEAIQAMVDERLISLDLGQIVQISKTVGEAIDRFQRDWLDIAHYEVAQASGTTVDYVRDSWREAAYITDSTLCCLLGHADSILLAPTNTWGT